MNWLNIYALGRYMEAFQSARQKRCIRCTIIQFICSICSGTSTATALQHVSCQLHTICTSGRFANLACCCFKMEMEMQTLQGAILSLPSRLNCFTTYKLLYYFSATREQCRAQQGHCCRTTVMIKERKTALHRQYILLLVP